VFWENIIMRTVLISAALLLVLGCSTGSAPSGPEPEAAIIQLSRAPEGTQYDTGPLSMHYAVEVKNTLAEPVTLRRVAVQSIGGGSYTLPAHSQGLNETIAPGETKRVSFWAPAFVAIQTVAGANGPVTLRGTLEFEAGTRKFQKIMVENISPEGGN
jgi:hypothetical protein